MRKLPLSGSPPSLKPHSYEQWTWEASSWFFDLQVLNSNVALSQLVWASSLLSFLGFGCCFSHFLSPSKTQEKGKKANQPFCYLLPAALNVSENGGRGSRIICSFPSFVICLLPYVPCELPLILKEHFPLYISQNNFIHSSLVRKTKHCVGRGAGVWSAERSVREGGPITNFRSVSMRVEIPHFLCFNSCYCCL